MITYASSLTYTITCRPLRSPVNYTSNHHACPFSSLICLPAYTAELTVINSHSGLCHIPQKCDSHTSFSTLFAITRNLILSMPFDLKDIKTTKGLKIVHVNIRSLLAHWDEVESVFLDGSLDIVVFTETWLHASCDSNLIEVQGYRCIRLDRQVSNRNGSTKKGGGICIFIKDDFDTVSWSNLDVSNSDIEMLSVPSKKGNLKRINLTIVYRPLTGNLGQSIDTLTECILEIGRNMSGNTVIVGDFNVDLLKKNVQSHRLEHLL